MPTNLSKIVSSKMDSASSSSSSITRMFRGNSSFQTIPMPSASIPSSATPEPGMAYHQAPSPPTLCGRGVTNRMLLGESAAGRLMNWERMRLSWALVGFHSLRLKALAASQSSVSSMRLVAAEEEKRQQVISYDTLRSQVAALHKMRNQ